MPFKSQAQRGYMYSNHPKLAKEFEEATPEGAKLPQHVKKMAEGGEVEPKKEEKPESDYGTLVGLRDMLRRASEQHGNEEKSMKEENTPHYADGGEVNPIYGMANMPTSPLPIEPPPITPMQPTVPSYPALGQVMKTVSQTPDTNYDFYKNLSADERMKLATDLQNKQSSSGNLLAQAAGGIGDAIANSFGGQNKTFQKDVMGIAEKNKEAQLGAFDTARQQQMQDMQASVEMQMNDPRSPISQSIIKTARAAGINVPSGMPGNVAVKVLGPLGEFALRQATLGVQTQVAEQNKSNQEAGRKLEAAKGLASRPWYQKAVEVIPPFKSGSTKAMESELNPTIGATPQMSPEDQQAISWAQANPNDPRSVQIMRLHGGR